MQKRTNKRLISIVAVTVVVTSIVAYGRIQSQSKLDTFLKQRAALFEKLDTNAANLPSGFEHIMLPSELPIHLQQDHIRSVFNRGQLWHGDSYASYDLKITEPLSNASARDITVQLCQHLSRGLNELGLRSSVQGGPDWILDQRAAHSMLFENSNRNLIVTLSVVVDMKSHSVHVTRYVHEQLD